MESENQKITKLIDHIFRHESGKIVSVLTKIFGTEHLELAEDVTQDSLLSAIRDWQFNGIPRNPTGWLYKVAKNKALNILNRDKNSEKYIATLSEKIERKSFSNPEMNALFSDKEIEDDQLRMMYICCHPCNSLDSQIALTLKTLCGFNAIEIAKAFFTSEETINKRLVRARQKIREEKIKFEEPGGKELIIRTENILEVIFLLFNEGYNASSGNEVIRFELCEEAIRLCLLLSKAEFLDDKTNVYSLLALLYLNVSRFQSRIDLNGCILTMEEQNRSLWNKEMIQAGINYLELALGKETVSRYTILATISAHHATAKDFASTDWNSILSMYDHLLEFDQSPLVKLNRAVALGKVKGRKFAIEELESFKSLGIFNSYYFYFVTLGELYKEEKNFLNAILHFEKGLSLAPNKAESLLVQKKISQCKE